MICVVESFLENPLNSVSHECCSIFIVVSCYHTKIIARPIEDVRDINDSKDLWKIAIRIRDLWYVKSVSNKEHLEMVLVDAKL